MLDRVLEYQLRVMRKLRHGPHRHDRYPVTGVVIYLSGRKSPQSLTLKTRLPGTKLGMRCKTGVMCLEREQARTTLERIDRGELGRSILIWVPLMAGGNDPAVVSEWVRLAKLEPDAERQKEYATLALVFAGWKNYLGVWRTPLEEWNMERISIVEEWRTDAVVRANRQILLRMLPLRFRTEVPADLKERIERTSDPKTLERWLEAFAEQSSLEGFRAVVEGGGASPEAGK
jgi:hypothetical protein